MHEFRFILDHRRFGLFILGHHISVLETQLITNMDQVEDKVQQPLLEQTEEKKTKLPFCIFLLSNGAVGT